MDQRDQSVAFDGAVYRVLIPWKRSTARDRTLSCSASPRTRRPTRSRSPGAAAYPIFRISEDLVEAYHVHVFSTYYLVGSDGTVRFSAARTDDAGDTPAAVRSALIALLGPPH